MHSIHRGFYFCSMDIEALYEVYLKHPVVCTDSRIIQPGCLFFALKGERFDGNQYAETAIKSGCAYAVVDDSSIANEAQCILVPDVLAALQKLAVLHRNQLKIPVLGITGSNGKTTTKELIQAVLQKKYVVSATKGNLNNHIGVPLTLLSIDANTEIAVIEMGANHQGEIGMLCEFARPTHGIITNVGKAHLEGFGSYEIIIKTKGELYDFIRTNGGEILLNSDDPILTSISHGIARTTYGSSASSDVVGQILEADPALSLSWSSAVDSKYDVATNLIGQYNFHNCLAAIAVGKAFGVPDEKIKEALSEYQPQNNRSQFLQTAKNKLILDAYNANPTSMAAAIRNFAEMKEENKFFLLGDMLELGASSIEEHQVIVNLLSELKLNEGILVGPLFKAVAGDKLTSVLNAAEAMEMLNRTPVESKLILLKGSRGIALEKLVDLL